MNILTFNIEEWFHILDNETTKHSSKWNKFEYRLENNLNRLVKILEEGNHKASFFCLGWVARKFPKTIRQLSDLGYEIGSHSDKHQLVYEQSKNEFVEDLNRSINTIEDLTGKKV